MACGHTLFFSRCLQVDYIITPTRVIHCKVERQLRPTGIQWSRITPQMLKDIPILRDLRERERKLGRDISLKEKFDCPINQFERCSIY